MIQMYVFDPPYLRKVSRGIDYWGMGLLVVRLATPKGPSVTVHVHVHEHFGDDDDEEAPEEAPPPTLEARRPELEPSRN